MVVGTDREHGEGGKGAFYCLSSYKFLMSKSHKCITHTQRLKTRKTDTVLRHFFVCVNGGCGLWAPISDFCLGNQC